MFFSARLDEAGTDGRSQYVVLAGGISTPEHWDTLEMSWDRLLKSRKVSAFHSKEFRQRVGDFKDWGDLKHRNFEKRLLTIIKKNVLIRISVAVDRDAHANIKKEWRNVKGFKADSDYGICFRVVRFILCEKVAKEFGASSRIQFLVEDGPFSSDANVIYKGLVRSAGAKYQPAKYAGMLAGFASMPKGLRSLETADYIAGQAVNDIQSGFYISPGRTRQVSILMGEEYLNRWVEGMVKEREKRKSFGSRRPSVPGIPSNG